MSVGRPALRKLEEMCERAVRQGGSDWGLIRARIDADRSKLAAVDADELRRTLDIMFADLAPTITDEAISH